MRVTLCLVGFIGELVWNWDREIRTVLYQIAQGRYSTLKIPVIYPNIIRIRILDRCINYYDRELWGVPKLTTSRLR